MAAASIAEPEYEGMPREGGPCCWALWKKVAEVEVVEAVSEGGDRDGDGASAAAEEEACPAPIASPLRLGAALPALPRLSRSLAVGKGAAAGSSGGRSPEGLLRAAEGGADGEEVAGTPAAGQVAGLSWLAELGGEAEGCWETG